MTTKSMAEVIHAAHCLERVHSEDCRFWADDAVSAAALSAAGFGLVADAGAKAPRMRRRGAARVLPPVEDQEPYVYPPDPHWGTDDRGRFQYVDYDGESLHVWRDKDGELWIDKKGEGPVYVRAQDATIIAAAVRGEG